MPAKDLVPRVVSPSFAMVNPTKQGYSRIYKTQQIYQESVVTVAKDKFTGDHHHTLTATSVCVIL